MFFYEMRKAYFFQPAYGGEHGDVNHAGKSPDFNASCDWELLPPLCVYHQKPWYIH
jgi:hypothetical protein